MPDKAPPPAPAEDAGEADPEEQVFLFTRDFSVDWTDNVSKRGAEAAKRHQAVSGYWHSLAPLARWCRIRSYLDSAAAHGITALCNRQQGGYTSARYAVIPHLDNRRGRRQRPVAASPTRAVQ